jgi:hypothetical protein
MQQSHGLTCLSRITGQMPYRRRQMSSTRSNGVVGIHFEQSVAPTVELAALNHTLGDSLRRELSLLQTMW